MTDYLLKFPTREIAVQFGIANGFASLGENGEELISIASHEYAICVIGPHNGDDWWVLFRDLVGMPVPQNADQFIYWCSDWFVGGENDEQILIPRPQSEDVPNVFWSHE